MRAKCQRVSLRCFVIVFIFVTETNSSDTRNVSVFDDNHNHFPGNSGVFPVTQIPGYRHFSGVFTGEISAGFATFQNSPAECAAACERDKHCIGFFVQRLPNMPPYCTYSGKRAKPSLVTDGEAYIKIGMETVAELDLSTSSQSKSSPAGVVQDFWDDNILRDEL